MDAIESLSEDELIAIESRAFAASDGPWFSSVVGRDLEAGLNFVELGSCETIQVLDGTVADQDFIVNAREDLPRLVQEIRSLRSRTTKFE